jgi:hypothetical protein
VQYVPQLTQILLSRMVYGADEIAEFQSEVKVPKFTKYTNNFSPVLQIAYHIVCVFVALHNHLVCSLAVCTRCLAYIAHQADTRDTLY